MSKSLAPAANDVEMADVQLSLIIPLAACVRLKLPAPKPARPALKLVTSLNETQLEDILMSAEIPVILVKPEPAVML